MERNRISSLQSHGKALEKECCLTGIFCDSGDTPANLLCELNGHLMPCRPTSCFYGKWVKGVCWPILSIRTLYFYYYYYYCWRARATYRRVFDDGEFVLVASEDGPVVVGVEHDDDDLERPGARRRPAAVDCPQPQPVLGPCLAVHALVQSQLHLPCIVLSCLRTLTTWHCPHSSAARRCCMQQPIDIS